MTEDGCDTEGAPVHREHAGGPKVFIVILNWNGLADTLECMASVAALSYPRWQAVVVDNGSNAGQADAIQSACPRIRLIRNPKNLGYTGGNNVGIEYAMAQGADYIWLLNNDTVVTPGSLSALVAVGEKDPRVGLLSPILRDYRAPHETQFSGTVLDATRGAAVTHKWLEEPSTWRPGRSLTLWGTALLIRRHVVTSVGYLNERYFAYHEDAEYCLRTLAAGFGTWVEPGAVVLHKSARSLGSDDSPVKEYLLVRNWYLLWSTHLRGWRRWIYPSRYIAWVLNRALNSKRAGRDRAAAHSLDGAWDALRGHFGPWDHRGAMPRLLSRFLLEGLLSWYPYLWIKLLDGEFLHVGREGIRRIFRRLRERTR
jgi:GT2 family glycosyltransferase